MNLSRIPTKKLKEILNDPYTRGITGKDYGPYLEELRDILWRRESKEFERESRIREKEQYFYENFVIFTLQDKDVIEWILANFKKLQEENYFNKK